MPGVSVSTVPHIMITAAALEALAERVYRLIPSHRDPERYHIEKSGIVHDLRRLARQLRQPPASFRTRSQIFGPQADHEASQWFSGLKKSSGGRFSRCSLGSG
jgi:hypothetical protein